MTHLPWFILVGMPGESSRAVLMGTGWVINVVVAEWVIRKGRARPSVVPATVRQAQQTFSIAFFLLFIPLFILPMLLSTRAARSDACQVGPEQ